MRFATSGLSITKRGAAEAFHCHFDEILNTGILQNVLLRGTWLENDIVWEYLRLFVAAARNHVALREKTWCLRLDQYCFRCYGKICVRKNWDSIDLRNRGVQVKRGANHFTDDMIFILTYICPSPGNCTAISSPDLISLLLRGRTLWEKRQNNLKSFQTN